MEYLKVSMKKSMKPLLLLALAVIAVSLGGCREYLWGTEELIERAREEFPIADADGIDIEYAGNSQFEEKFLHWFISGNEYQEHVYLPMECTLVSGEGFRFERVYQPMMRGDDIAVVQWNGGYAFCVNNSACRTIRIVDSFGENEVRIADKDDRRPFVYFHPYVPIEY